MWIIDEEAGIMLNSDNIEKILCKENNSIEFYMKSGELNVFYFKDSDATHKEFYKITIGIEDRHKDVFLICDN